MDQKKEYSSTEYEMYLKWQRKRERERVWRIMHGLSLRSVPVIPEKSPPANIVKKYAQKYLKYLQAQRRWYKKHKKSKSAVGV